MRRHRDGRPVARARGAKPPCVICPKIPPEADPRPENAVEVTPQLLDAFGFYEECRAVGSFPADPLVRACAVEFRAAEESIQRAESRRLALTVLGNAIRGQ